jgi:hypothetical protein
MEKPMNTDDTHIQKVHTERDEGETQLSLLIHQAGDDARIRRKKMLDEHFKKLNDMIAESVSSNKRAISA